jgi:hypothetical protein
LSKTKSRFRRNIFLMACITFIFVYSAIYIFDIGWHLILEIFFMSLAMIIIVIGTALLLTIAIKLLKKWKK